MYVRQFAYRIVSGNEERAVALCERFARTLRDHGVRARVLVGQGDATLQLVEEYTSNTAMTVSRAALERDPAYRAALVAWASDFYPLVQAAAPAVLLHDRPAA